MCLFDTSSFLLLFKVANEASELELQTVGESGLHASLLTDLFDI